MSRNFYTPQPLTPSENQGKRGQERKRQGGVMATTKGFWQHIPTGKIYAVESTTFGKIVGGVGPWDPADLHDLDDYDYTPAILEWLERAVAEHKLRRIHPNQC